MKQLLAAIRKRLGELSNLKEENIKNHIVVNIFLKSMGFDPDNFNYEDSVNRNRVDITYQEKGRSIFLVETKAQLIGDKISKDLTETDVRQLLDYLNNYHSNIKWGLLTNGSHYILLNRDIQGDPLDKIVLNITISKYGKEEYWSYFSYESLFETKVTNYLADIAQYKAYRKQDGLFKEGTWAPYWSALFRFFDFYGKTHQYISRGSHPHEPLSKIEVDAFYDYIKHITENPSNKKQISSKETINSSYSYISSFFNTLCEKGYISSHNFVYGRDNTLAVYDDTPKQKSENYLTVERYRIILEFLWSYKSNTCRNIVIFLLCSYYGFDRSDVLNLSWDHINFNKNTITYDNRTLEMTKLIKFCLESMYKEQNALKKKCKNVIVRIQDNKASKPNESLINSTFDILTKIDTSDESWGVFSPQYVKMNLPIKMFEVGYSIEQIVYYLGIDIKHITNYIPSNIIISEGKKRLYKAPKAPSHPFKDIVDQFYNEKINS